MNPDSLTDRSAFLGAMISGVFLEGVRKAMEVEELRSSLLSLGLTEEDLEVLHLYARMMTESEWSILAQTELAAKGYPERLRKLLDNAWEEVTRP